MTQVPHVVSVVSTSASVILRRGDNVLLIHENYGRRRWSLPSGAVGPGETPWEAAVTGMRSSMACWDLLVLFHRSIRTSRWPCAFGLVMLVAVACASNGSVTSHTPSTVSTPTETTSLTPGAEACPVTRPNGQTPPGEARSPDHHGNGALWTALPPDGKIWAGPNNIMPDGSIDVKFPWWRGVRGLLTISGRRLDVPAPPLRADIPDYGLTGFQASGVIFPTEGCWEVTGRVDSTSLTFVTLVLKPT